MLAVERHYRWAARRRRLADAKIARMCSMPLTPCPNGLGTFPLMSILSPSGNTCSRPRRFQPITFSGMTLYEVYDQYGNIVKRGYANSVDVSALKKDLYYLNYDNKMGETFIKR